MTSGESHPDDPSHTPGSLGRRPARQFSGVFTGQWQYRPSVLDDAGSSGGCARPPTVRGRRHAGPGSGRRAGVLAAGVNHSRPRRFRCRREPCRSGATSEGFCGPPSKIHERGSVGQRCLHGRQVTVRRTLGSGLRKALRAEGVPGPACAGPAVETGCGACAEGVPCGANDRHTRRPGRATVPVVRAQHPPRRALHLTFARPLRTRQ